jgi:putative transcriptional regulator
MPIRVKLDRMLVERRMSLTELADRVGVTLANLSILKTGKARAVRFSTLDALCRALNCQPGDLLVFEPGPPDTEEEEEGLEGAEAEGGAPEGFRHRVLRARRSGGQKPS